MSWKDTVTSVWKRVHRQKRPLFGKQLVEKLLEGVDERGNVPDGFVWNTVEQYAGLHNAIDIRDAIDYREHKLAIRDNRYRHSLEYARLEAELRVLKTALDAVTMLDLE